jgi:hypothetical protein
MIPQNTSDISRKIMIAEEILDDFDGMLIL